MDVTIFDLNQVKNFYNKNKQKIYTQSFVYNNYVYLSTTLCKELLHMCVQHYDDSILIDTCEVRDPTPYENSHFTDNIGVVIALATPSGKLAYIMDQTGVFFQLDQEAEPDSNLLYYVHNFVLIFETLQQTFKADIEQYKN